MKCIQNFIWKAWKKRLSSKCRHRLYSNIKIIQRNRMWGHGLDSSGWRQGSGWLSCAWQWITGFNKMWETVACWVTTVCSRRNGLEWISKQKDFSPKKHKHFMKQRVFDTFNVLMWVSLFPILQFVPKYNDEITSSDCPSHHRLRDPGKKLHANPGKLVGYNIMFWLSCHLLIN